MRTIVLFLLLIIFGNTQKVNAQIQYGLKGGLNYVNNEIINTPYEINDNSKYRLAYHVGAFAKIELSKKISFKPELLFSSKGYEISAIENVQPSGDGNLHLNYINLPLLIGYEFFDKMAINVGPELGYLLSAKAKYDSKTIDLEEAWDNKFDFGISTGINYHLDENIALEIRYTHGLSSVIKDIMYVNEDGEYLDSDEKFQNRTFQFSVSYRLK